jgi:predicted kinase
LEAIIFCGIQATGKTTFYQQNFMNSHVRISMDLLKTRNRERRFLQLCIDTQQKLLVDNTNPSKELRKNYIDIAKSAGYKIIGYYFQSKINDALIKNDHRRETERIPELGIRGTFNKLEIPSFDEGFDELYYVKIANDHSFIIEKWQDEV